jgi:RNA polymerase sigma-70 factor, ECF subfamily
MRAVTEQSGSEPSDATLLARIAAGHDDAFATLVLRYRGRFYGVARRMLGGDADAEDAVQAALFRIYRNASAYRDRWSGSTWLYRVLTNVCIDHWRKRRRLAEAPDPDDALESRPVERLDVDRALAKLPAEARAILLLCYVEGLPYAEIARVRGISVNTVKTQLSRAKRLMRRHLSEVKT